MAVGILPLGLRNKGHKTWGVDLVLLRELSRRVDATLDESLEGNKDLVVCVNLELHSRMRRGATIATNKKPPLLSWRGPALILYTNLYRRRMKDRRRRRTDMERPWID